MIVRYLFLFFCFFGAVFNALAQEKPPVNNLSADKEKLINYHDSGQYYRQIGAVVKEALAYLQFRVNQNSRLSHPHKLAIVLDVDETALTNYPDILHLDFGGTSEEINDLRAAGHDQAIPAVQTLYNYAEDHNIAVFFITRRKEYERQATTRNLKAVGYPQWQELFMEPNDYDSPLAGKFKRLKRKLIIGMGYDIVLNVGDQKSDVEGGYADMSFKVPNPFYRVG